MKKSTIVSIGTSLLGVLLFWHVMFNRRGGSNSVEPVLATSTDQKSSPDKSVSENEVASSENASHRALQKM